MMNLARVIRPSALKNLRPIIANQTRFLRTIPMDSRKEMIYSEAPVLSAEQAAECFAKRTMTYDQAIDYVFYRGSNPKQTLFRAFFLAALVGFVVSTIAVSTSEKLEHLNYDAVATAIQETKSLNPLKILNAIYSALDLAVPNKEYYTSVEFPQTSTSITHREVDLPLSDARKKLNRDRVKFNLPPLPALKQEEMTTRPMQLLAVGLRAMGGFDYISYARAYTFGIYMNKEVLPAVLKAAVDKPEAVPSVEAALLSHGVADKTIRMVFCQDAAGSHVADGFTKTFRQRINTGVSTGDCEDGVESGNNALEKLQNLVSLVPKFKTGDEITLTWSLSGALVVTLPDHALDHLDFYKELFPNDDSFQNRARLRDSPEWKQIITKIREQKPAYPAPSLILNEPLRPAAIIQSPTLARAIFQSFTEPKPVSVSGAAALRANWDSLLDQFEDSRAKKN